MSNTIPEGWSVLRQGDICEFSNGRAYKLSEWEKQGTPVIRLQNLTGSGKEFYYSNLELPERQYCNNGDLLYMWSATFGPHIWKGQKAIYHYHIWKVTPDEVNLTKDYSYQLLGYKTQEWLNQSNGMGILHVTKGGMEDLSLILPPLPEQQKIAAILSSVDDVIEKTQAQIDKLKDLKTGMMQELLTKGIGHTEFKDSPVGRIPVGWDVASIGSVAKLTSGGTPNRERLDYWGGSIPWVKTGEINYATIFRTEESITKEGLNGSSAKIVPAGAVLMAMYGQGVTRGKVAILGVDSTMNQACLAMIPSDRISNCFLFYFLTREYENLRSLVQEGAQKNLSATIVKEVLMPIPQLDEQERIVSGLKAADQKLGSALEKVESMKNLKQALMQDLLTGKVRVKVDT